MHKTHPICKYHTFLLHFIIVNKLKGFDTEAFKNTKLKYLVLLEWHVRLLKTLQHLFYETR